MLFSSVYSFSIDCVHVANLASQFGVPTTSVNGMRNQDCCVKTGITCVTNRITEINWSNSVFGSKLSGTFNSTAFNGLTNLKKFEIYYNLLTGSLPSAYPTNLVYFDVDGNDFTGVVSTIPSKIEVLWLKDNSLTGTLPVFPSCLKELHIEGGNSFIGTLSVFKPTTLTIQNNALSVISVSDPSLLVPAECNISNNNVDLRDVWYLKNYCTMTGISSKAITTIKSTKMTVVATSTTFKVTSAITSTMRFSTTKVNTGALSKASTTSSTSLSSVKLSPTSLPTVKTSTVILRSSATAFMPITMKSFIMPTTTINTNVVSSKSTSSSIRLRHSTSSLATLTKTTVSNPFATLSHGVISNLALTTEPSTRTISFGHKSSQRTTSAPPSHIVESSEMPVPMESIDTEEMTTLAFNFEYTSSSSVLSYTTTTDMIQSTSTFILPSLDAPVLLFGMNFEELSSSPITIAFLGSLVLLVVVVLVLQSKRKRKVFRNEFNQQSLSRQFTTERQMEPSLVQSMGF